MIAAGLREIEAAPATEGVAFLDADLTGTGCSSSVDCQWG